MSLLPFNPFSEEFTHDRYAVYRRYLADGPIHPGVVGQPGRWGDTWYVFGYNQCVQVLKDSRLGREGLYAHQPSAEPSVLNSILLLDPPNHTRLRRLVNLAFTPRAVEQALPRLDTLIKEVLDDLEGRDSWDLIQDFAFPFPVTVISDLLGVPIADRGLIRQWSRALTAGIDATQDRDTFVQAQKANHAFRQYVREVIRDHRAHPQEDLLTALLQAREEGDRLTEDELITMVTLLVVAGHETTVNLIGNGLWALFQHPKAWATVRAQGLSDRGVDELLRYDSSVQATSRLCNEPITINDTDIAEGDVVICLLGSANHDPQVFSHPEQLDLERYPNRHLSFGGGIHTCLGNTLARAEGRVAINALLTRYPGLRPLESQPRWRPGFVFRGLESLAVSG
ncbi:MAG: cytochrome P450 [Thermaerobacter sp.]|nr:cytochrome P450 [Thermaerobacter sp.]